MKIILPEGVLVKQIIWELRSRGLKAGKVKVMGVRNANGSYRNDKYLFLGLPDIVAFDEKNKIMYAIEAKSGYNKQSDEQKEFQRLFHCPPSRIYAVIYSIDELDTLMVLNNCWDKPKRTKENKREIK